MAQLRVLVYRSIEFLRFSLPCQTYVQLSAVRSMDGQLKYSVAIRVLTTHADEKRKEGNLATRVVRRSLASYCAREEVVMFLLSLFLYRY